MPPRPLLDIIRVRILHGLVDLFNQVIQSFYLQGRDRAARADIAVGEGITMEGYIKKLMNVPSVTLVIGPISGPHANWSALRKNKAAAAAGLKGQRMEVEEGLRRLFQDNTPGTAILFASNLTFFNHPK
ncbi:MAG: hypothetical protein M1836_004034 [Candelina mexicana]|nr:MAG: hypothetical protein M1836_004034 [Candelina mexicana]